MRRHTSAYLLALIVFRPGGAILMMGRVVNPVKAP